MAPTGSSPGTAARDDAPPPATLDEHGDVRPGGDGLTRTPRAEIAPRYARAARARDAFSFSRREVESGAERQSAAANVAHGAPHRDGAVDGRDGDLGGVGGERRRRRGRVDA